MNLHHRPLFLFTIIYICGIVCAVQTGMHALAGFAVAGGLFLLGCAVPSNIMPRPVVGILAAFFAVGFVRAGVFLQVPINDVSQYAEGKMVYLTGTVTSDPEPLSDKTRFVLKVSKVKTYTGEYPASGQAMVTLYQPRYKQEYSSPVPFYGEQIRVHGRLRKPQPVSYPGAMDYGKYLANKRIYCTLSGGLDEVGILRPAAWKPQWMAAKLKAVLTSKAHELLPPVHAKLLLGILLGNYASLPSDVQTAFVKSGTLHLLAASGYNCGVIIGIFGFLLRRMTSPRKATHWLLISLIWMFTLIVGSGPSIVRAAVMVTAFLAAYLFRRAPDMINIVFFSGLAILGANPLMLYDVGFQLSFAAVLSIMLILPLIEPHVKTWFVPARRHGRSLLGWLPKCMLWTARDIAVAVLLAAVAFLGTWPITAYYFNYISTVSFIANALVALLVVALTAAGIAALSLGWVWSALGHIVAYLVTGISGAMLGIVTGLGMHPWSSVSVYSPTPVFIVLYYAVLLGVLEYAHKKVASVQRMVGNI